MANLNYNSVTIAGRLTADVELKTTPSGLSVCSFTVAVNRRTKEGEEQKADFFNVTAWRQTADFVSRYFHKGSSIFVVGVLQNRMWEKDGQKHYATDILAQEIRFVDSKSETAGQYSAQPTYTPQQPAQPSYVPEAYTTPAPQFEDLGGDEELHF